MNPKIIYLAGQITDDPNYKQKFDNAADELTGAGFIVINPATLPPGLNYHTYIKITTVMIDCCEAVCLLQGWIKSKGAMHEFNRALICGLGIFNFEEWKIDNIVTLWING